MGHAENMKFAGIFSGRTLRGATGILTFAAIWEIFARSGIFPQSLTPPISAILTAAYYLLINGNIVFHIVFTIMRVIAGLAIACAIAVPLGFAMGRSKRAATIFEPALSTLMPIPSLAWIPFFILFLGLGNITTILVVVYAAFFPMVYNVWRGVQSINPVWLRAGLSMGSNSRTMFWRIIFPASLPFIITGLRTSYGRAWMAVIGGELLAGTDWGLGRLIFEAKEWLNTGSMMTAIAIIGVIALISERAIFETIDRQTVARWGMVRSAD
jgi:NitT/TauT family transport system permease protein